jgi:hypothetical protein
MAYFASIARPILLVRGEAVEQVFAAVARGLREARISYE